MAFSFGMLIVEIILFILVFSLWMVYASDPTGEWYYYYYTILSRVSSRGNHFGGKLQEMGVALYTFLYNCPKFGGGGGSFPPCPPPDETLLSKSPCTKFEGTSLRFQTLSLVEDILYSRKFSLDKSLPSPATFALQKI